MFSINVDAAMMVERLADCFYVAGMVWNCAGVADLDDPALKDRIDGLKTIRDQAKADAERAQAMLQNSGQKAVTPQMLRKFAATARERIRLEGGGYRRDARRGRRRRSQDHGIEVPAATDADGGKWRKLSAHSRTEMAERKPAIARKLLK